MARRSSLLASRLNSVDGLSAEVGDDDGDTTVEVLIVVAPASPRQLRELLARRNAAPPIVLVALSLDWMGKATAFLKAGADDILWLPLNIEDAARRTLLWLERHEASRDGAMDGAAMPVAMNRPPLIIGNSPAMRAVLTKLDLVARNDATVLVSGETGTGKELIARELHHRSARRDGPFIAVNLAAVPKDLVESELFGHVAGAFTGALSAREGRIEVARGGTLFLDEVGELPLEVQVKLLRVLQERTFERVGDNTVRNTDFRLVCATHRDLEALVEAGSFREDLFYRLNVVELELPPLRARGADMLLLAEAFLAQLAGRFGVRVELGQAARDALVWHDWPGNVRELQHTIERALATAHDGDILGPDIVGKKRKGAKFAALASELVSRGSSLDDALTELELAIVAEAMQRSRGSQRRAAQLLRIPRQTLQSRMRKHQTREQSSSDATQAQQKDDATDAWEDDPSPPPVARMSPSRTLLAP